MKLVFTLTLLLSLPTWAQNHVSMSLTAMDRTDNYTTPRRIILKAMASDNKSYEASVSCIPKANNTSNKDLGYIYVMSSEYHIGVRTSFDFQACLELVSNLKNDRIGLELFWISEELEDLKVGGLEFELFDVTDMGLN